MDRRYGELPRIPRGSIFVTSNGQVDHRMPYENGSRQTRVEEIDEMIEQSKIFEDSLRKLRSVVAAQEAYRETVQVSTRPRLKESRTQLEQPQIDFNPHTPGRGNTGFDCSGAVDLEKADSFVDTIATTATDATLKAPPQTLARRYYNHFIAENIEPRGIQRVEAHERHDAHTFGFVQVALAWFSINLVACNITLGMIGPVVLNLGFLDASLCAILGMLLGNLPVAYIATFGPRSGLRTLSFSRYIMGWHPAKLTVLLNIVDNLGYSMINCVIAGQMLSAVSSGSNLSVVIGIVIVSIITLVVSTFGYQVFHYYERYAWVPQLVALCILAGVAGPDFNIASTSQGTSATIAGNRLSFFSLCFAAAIAYCGCSGTFFVYYPESTAGWKVFLPTMISLSLSFAFTHILGVGLACGMTMKRSWQEAYDISQGALIVAGYAPLGPFGSFCSVLVALGLVANVIPCAYVAGVDFQVLGRYAEKVPRMAWNLISIVIFTVCAIAGRESLVEVFTNFLALMGYWCSIWIAIVLEEHYLFRKPLKLTGRRSDLTEDDWDWIIWDKKDLLPLGIAATVATLAGWAGAILCMAQNWYIGPIARLVGDNGADVSSPSTDCGIPDPRADG